MPRHRGRIAALKMLFEEDLAHPAVEALLERGLAEVRRSDREFVIGLVQGTLAHRAEIDAAIESVAVGWRIGRMPAVDRNILRLATYELGWTPEVPASVVIDEAVELADTYSTPEGKRFINGVLASLARRYRPQEVAP
ncbi:MAG: transcription antitermination factor NusB [Firmicutes bacterium]|nr:transcription antitermination factor NusB [Alicyclobacillaceae bacterium]MCL6496675.1 transcription antitermination factor NusB [Bacillota bacterium]